MHVAIRTNLGIKFVFSAIYVLVCIANMDLYKLDDNDVLEWLWLV